MLEGKLIAEFSSFYEATDKATVKFRSFEEEGAKVEKRLNSIADGFSGRKVIQEAALVSEAIERIGGVSKLSTTEAAQGLSKLEAAMDKMLKTGQDIPVSMTKTAAELRNVTRVTDEADKTVARISENYKKFDGILQSLGVNIGPYVKGLEDITAIAGGGAAKLGFFGAAAAVVGTAIASWKLGEKIGEVSGLTNEIAKGISVIMGWGDVDRQRALAIADSLDLMGKAEANEKRVKEATEAHAKAIKEESDELKENWRITEGNKDAMANLARQLEETKEKRKADAIATFQASQAQSMFSDETEAATQAIQEQAAALDAREQHIKEAQDQEAKRQAEIDAFMNAPTLNDRVNPSTSFDVAPLTGFALDQVKSDFHRAGDNDNGEKALRRALESLEAREGRSAPKTNEQFFQLQRDQILLAQLRMMFGNAPSFAGGVENFGGGLAYVHRDEALVNMPRGTSVIPAGRGMGGGGTVVNNHFYVNGTGEDVAREVSAILMRDLQSNRLISLGR